MVQDRQPQFQTLLEELLEIPDIWFQAPPNMSMEYPAVVYKRDTINTGFADNIPYMHNERWMVTVIDRDSSNPNIRKIQTIPTAVFVRNYVSDGLTHDIFNIYF